MKTVPWLSIKQLFNESSEWPGFALPARPFAHGSYSLVSPRPSCVGSASTAGTDADGFTPLDDTFIDERLRVTLQRWLDATAAEISKKIKPIGNLGLETTPCCPKLDEQAEWLQGVLHLLAPQQQTLLKQHLIEGVGLRDLGQCHELSQRRLKQLLQNGIKSLRLLAIQDGFLVPPRPLPSQLPEAFAPH